MGNPIFNGRAEEEGPQKAAEKDWSKNYEENPERHVYVERIEAVDRAFLEAGGGQNIRCS